MRAVHESAPEAPLEEATRAELETELAHHEHLDSAIDRAVTAKTSNLLPSPVEPEAKAIFRATRPEGQLLMDDWDCHKERIQRFEGPCFPLGQYGMNHGRAFANIGNRGLTSAFTPWPGMLKLRIGPGCPSAQRGERASNVGWEPL